jgi:MFS family permease
LLVAFVLMVPLIIVAEKRRKMKGVVIIGAVIIAISLFGMSAASQLWHWIVLMLLYFWGFNLMEASLPSWLSKIAPAGAKGSAMGIYSSMQFFGAFVGGSVGGWLLQDYGSGILFVGMGALVLIWALIILQSSAPRYHTSVRLPTSQAFSESRLTELKQLPGVAEAQYFQEENAIYLKVSADVFERDNALAIIESTGE